MYGSGALRVTFLVLLAFCAMTTLNPALGQHLKSATIGSWLVSEKRDPFEDGRVLTAISVSGKNLLAIRCFSGRLSVVMVAGSNRRGFLPEQRVAYDYRADQGPINSYVGQVFGDDNITLPNSLEILRDATTRN